MLPKIAKSTEGDISNNNWKMYRKGENSAIKVK
jgi:hypothetical protein